MGADDETERPELAELRERKRLLADEARPEAVAKRHGSVPHPDAVRWLDGIDEVLYARVAAHELCPRIPGYRRRHHLQAGAGHFGVFSGRRWQGQVYPAVQGFIAANS